MPLRKGIGFCQQSEIGRFVLFFLYIKILVSEQGNAVCEKLSNCHNLLIMRNDKKDYRNSQHFAFAF